MNPKEQRFQQRLEARLRDRGILFEKGIGRSRLWDYDFIGLLKHVTDLKQIRRWEAGKYGNGNQEAFVHFQEQTQVPCILTAIRSGSSENVPVILAQCDARINEKGEMCDVPNGRLEKKLRRYNKEEENDCYIFMPEDIKTALGLAEQRAKFEGCGGRKGRLSVAVMLALRRQQPMKIDALVNFISVKHR